MQVLHGSCVELQPPSGWLDAPRPWIFLGGAIDQGAAPNWQAEVIAQLTGYPLTVLNPRRSHWVLLPSESYLREQVDWELDAQETADLRLYVFPAGTHAPITLLELGLYHRAPCWVYIDPGYTRAFNARAVCDRYGIPYATDWTQFLAGLHQRIRVGRF